MRKGDFSKRAARYDPRMSKNETGIGARDFESAYLKSIAPAAADFDEMGHVNNAVYLKWAQQIAVSHWRLIAGAEMGKRWLWVVLRHEIDYRDPILPGDEVVARTWLAAADGPRFDRFIDIRKPGAARAAAVVKSTWVLLDALTRRPKRVTRDILQAFGVSG